MVERDGGPRRRHAAPLQQRGLAFAAVAHLCAGCFDAPREYSVPERGPPVIDRFGVVPDPGAVQVETNPDVTISFSVPFRADDQGSDLQAFFWRDYNPLNPPQTPETLLGFPGVPASELPFDEQVDRAVTANWSPRGLGGCHSVTMFLTYVDNVDTQATPPIMIDRLLVAKEQWWFRFETPDATDFHCPSVPVDPSF